ncbi:MAG: hypothetical protein MUC59_12410 [Saprospiraceae bacterium]|jgi:hypothetical protein|nr:hypothetical protein [Saprospiraceae bacterium]
MLGETYHTSLHPDNEFVYFFVSRGQKGEILKAVLFQQYKVKNKFNLAFGDVQNGKLSDEAVSNNNDFVKVLSTVAKCAYDFLERNPGIILHIQPVDDRRKLLYNAIFRRHFEALTEQFEIWGRKNRRREPFQTQKDYDSFELIQRR